MYKPQIFYFTSLHLSHAHVRFSKSVIEKKNYRAKNRAGKENSSEANFNTYSEYSVDMARQLHHPSNARQMDKNTILHPTANDK